MERKCRNCDNVLTEDNWSGCVAAKRKVYECRPCLALKAKRWRQANIHHNRAYQTRYQKQNHEGLLYYRIKANAKARNLDFDLGPQDLTIPEYCPVLGIKLEWTDGKTTDNTPSVDRIDPEKGYVHGNVMVISWLANRIKSNASAATLMKVALWVQQMENRQA